MSQGVRKSSNNQKIYIRRVPAVVRELDASFCKWEMHFAELVYPRAFAKMQSETV